MKKKCENKGFLEFSHQVLKPQKHSSCLRIQATIFCFETGKHTEYGNEQENG